jgi:hypothetical protein
MHNPMSSGIIKHMIATPDQFGAWAGIAANVATASGVVTAVTLFIWDRAKERHAREMSAYSNLNEQYMDYLRRCIEDPSLVAAEVEDNQYRKRDLHICMVLCMLESAYFMYRDQSTAFREKQWTGWNAYMKYWCMRTELQDCWKLIEQFDTDFVNHMNQLLESAKLEAKQQTSLKTGPPPASNHDGVSNPVR